MKTHTSGLRFRLSLILLLALIPELGMAFYTWQEQRQYIARETQEEASRLARQAATGQEQVIESTRNLLVGLSRLDEIRDRDAAKCARLFADLRAQYPYYAGITASTADGEVFCSDPPARGRVNFSDREWYQRLVQTGGFVVSEYQIGRVSGQPVMAAAYPLFDETGHLQAIVGVGINLSWFDRLIAQADLEKDTTLTVVDRSGRILARLPDGAQWLGKTAPEATILQGILSTQGAGEAGSAAIDGVSRVYAWVPLRWSMGDTGTSVLVGLPVAPVFANVNRILLVQLLGLGLVTILTLGALVVVSDLSIVRQVEHLLAATRRLASGDLSARTGASFGLSEIRQLAGAFDQMAEALENRESQFRQAEAKYRSLVEKVPAIIYTADPGEAFHPVYASPQTEALLGFTPEEWLAEPGAWRQRIHPGDLERVSAQIAADGAQDAARISEYRLLTRSSHFRWFRDESVLVQDEGGKPLFRQGVMLDITDRKEAGLIQDAVYRIAQATDQAGNLNDLFSVIQSIIGEVMPADNFYIAIYHESDHSLSFPYYVDEVDESPPAGKYAFGKGLTEYVLRMGKSLLCDPALEADLTKKGEIEPVGSPALIWLGVPLAVDGKIIGVMAVQHYRDPGAYGDRERRMLEFVSTQAAMAITRKRSEEALQQSEERYRYLFDHAPIGIGIADLTGKVLAANPSMLEATGFRLEELQAGSVDILYADSEDRQQFLARLKEKSAVRDDQALLLRKDGSHFYALINADLIELEGREVIFTTLRDISERVRMEENTRREAVRARLLADVSKMMAEAQRDLRRTLQAVAETIAQTIGDTQLGDACLICFVSEDGQSILPVAYQHANPEAAPLRQEFLVPTAHPVADGYFQEAIQTGNPVLVTGVTLDQLHAAVSPRLYPNFDRHGIDSLLLIPMCVRSQVIGILGILRDRPGGDFTPEDRLFHQHLADRIALAIANARLYEQEQARNRELSMLISLSSRLREAQDSRAVLGTVLQEMRQLLDADSGMIVLKDPDRKHFTVTHAEGELKANLGRTIRLDEDHRGIDLSILKPYLTADYASEGHGLAYLHQGSDVGPAIFVPIRSDVEQLGVLMLGRQRGEGVQPFSAAHARLFSAVGEMAGNALRKARLYEEVRRRLGQLQALREIDLAITGSVDLHIRFKTILDQVISQMQVDAAAILYMNPYTQVLEYAASRGFRTPALQRTRLRLGEGYAGRAALEQRTIQVFDLQNRKTDFLRSPHFFSEGFVVYFAIPLIAKGQVKGILEIFHRSPLEPTEEWMEFLEALAGQAAIAIDNANLFDNLRITNQSLKLAYDATIEGWSRALDLRDKETEGHSQRVAEMTLQLALAMGISEPESVQIRRGALLHDIGKMGIPDTILLKAGALTEEEWGLMRKHPIYAYELLSPIAFLAPALDIPYCHHEKWDGSGYPRGLRKDQIPLAARIFAIVDVWDALSSDRTYRPAWPQEKIIHFIQEQSGIHFDPQVVEVFLKHLTENGLRSG